MRDGHEWIGDGRLRKGGLEPDWGHRMNESSATVQWKAQVLRFMLSFYRTYPSASAGLPLLAEA
ncbi:MAG: hypothetical protein WCO60_16925 [Verrucomicrobiota bacterium]